MRRGKGAGGAHLANTVNRRHIVHVEAQMRVGEMVLVAQEEERHHQLPDVDVPPPVCPRPLPASLKAGGGQVTPAAV